MGTVRRHAHEIIEKRLASAQPRNDGRQTPHRGHPVFVALHATATCCRTCLKRRHGIPAGHALDDAELDYVVEVICRWIARQYAPTGDPSLETIPMSVAQKGGRADKILAKRHAPDKLLGPARCAPTYNIL